MLKRTLVAIVSVCGFAGSAVAGPDEDAVRHLLHSTFDKPENQLVVEPVVVAANYAIAGWTQGDMGGRALLNRKGHHWQIVLCSGDQLKSSEALAKAAVPKATADELAKGLAKAEASLDPKIVAQFSRFEGLVMIDEASDHPPHHR